MFTPIRVVCSNTLTFAVDSGSDRQVKIGHRGVFSPEIVKEQLGIATEKMAKYKEIASFLGSKRYTSESYIDYINTVFPRSSDKRVKEGMTTAESLSRNAKLALDVWKHNQVQTTQRFVVASIQLHHLHNRSRTRS